MLETFWKPKKKKHCGIILKSGKEIRVTCDKFSWTLKDNKIVGYEMEGCVPAINYLDMDEIATIITYKA